MTVPSMRKQYHLRLTERGLLIWDVDRLVELSKNLPQRAVPLSEISELEEPYWFGLEGDRPTCRAVADHARLMAEADLRYPIILCADGRVMDGMHRVAKAYMEGRPTVLAVRLTRTPEPDYIDVDPDTLPYDDAAEPPLYLEAGLGDGDLVPAPSSGEAAIPRGLSRAGTARRSG